MIFAIQAKFDYILPRTRSHQQIWTLNTIVFMNLIWSLAALAVFLLLTLIVTLVIYFRREKVAKEDQVEQDDNQNSPQTANGVDVQACLNELKHQKEIVEKFIIDCDPEDKKRHMLFECWSLFLDVEYAIISTQSMTADIDTALEKFTHLTDDVGFAQSMDVLVKQISAQKKLSDNMIKEIEEKNKMLMLKTETSSLLNDKLEALRAELSEEMEVDQALLDIRLELATLWRLESHIKEQLATNSNEMTDGVEPEYQNLLESFLEDSNIEDFMAPIQDEYQGKLEQLKAMADYQKTVIAELKSAVKEVNGKDGGNSLNYDVALARLEKTFADKKDILHKLEAKLDSLQAIKQSLTLDFQKQDALVTAKTEELKSQDSINEEVEKSAMQSILEQQQTSVQAMEDLFDQAPLVQASEQLIKEQSSKIESIKKMVDESELFVELLEQDLDKEQKIQDDMQLRLAELSEKLVNISNTSVSDSEVERLKEENEELEAEIRVMEKELVSHSDAPNEEIEKLKTQVAELDEKITKMKADYAQMEEKYLSALL